MNFYSGVTVCSGVAIIFSACIVGNVQAIQIEKLVVSSVRNSVFLEKNAVIEDVPMGQGGDQASLLPEDVEVNEASLVGGQGGYFHANLVLQEEYTDNLYNIDSDKTSNFLTIISPELWFSIPRKKDIPVSLAPNNTSSGGMAQQSKDYEGTDRYQAYALGGLDFKYYSEDEDLNTINGLVEGMFRLNMRGGLSLQILDRYTRDQDKYEVVSVVGKAEEQFDTNIVLATADWTITEKLRGKFEYSNFWLDYDDDVNTYQDRADNVFDLYGYFNYSIKTSFFLEGKMVDVQYDTATENDNDQYFVYGGIKWDTTEKVSLMAKAGWQNKKYDSTESDAGIRSDYDGLAVDVQATYKFSQKTDFSLDVFRANDETDSVLASDKTVLGGTFVYNQKFTDKFSGSMAFNYEDVAYTQLIEQERDDTVFSIQPAVRYLFREWLKGEVSYQFEKRDSTDDLFDYQTNSVFANVKFAI